ncbi:MAG: EscU/YscU/HrcU family type III secretion system export apparatus switch protein [Verrucomicrobia bacterium]|nr:EscU/YscU/HrcU family type III secretion system export apparatus switch protein [Verrucomicrobiota bacterium]MBI3871070.1 EscU/YscU/HrcU family type III secretion system export apparatus switch protein [Verrucomicrobiota bacterium]
MPEQLGEKIHEPSQRRMDEALRRGQIPVSAEVQTAFVLIAFLGGMTFAGRDLWFALLGACNGVLGHLHEFNLSPVGLQRQGIDAALYLARTTGPLLLAIASGALLAGALQSRFQTFSDALRFDWERVSPLAGFSRIFSGKSMIPTSLAVLKLLVIILLTYSQVMQILQDPIFVSSVSAARVAEFLWGTAQGILIRVTVSLAVIAMADYGYQFWRNRQDLMMTHEEMLDEQKTSEGNPQVKAALKQRRQRLSKRRMLLEVPKADFVVTNPTHLAIALRYDRKTMRAPMVVAKGSRLNALRIREIAQQHQVPIIENKPLARMLFKHSKVGGEIPAQFYAAVAELLAYVYRVNRYRYYAEQNRPTS